jgi:hypothetical protein
MQKIGDGILEFLSSRIPDSILKMEVESDNIKFLFEASAVYVYPHAKRVIVNGKLADVAFALARRLDIHFIHWNSFTGNTFLNCSLTRPNFIEKVELLIALLLVFPDIDLKKFFKDKIALSILKRNEYVAKMYLTSSFGLVLVDIKNENKPLTIQLSSKHAIEKLLSTTESENFIKLICDDELEKYNAENRGAEE